MLEILTWIAAGLIGFLVATQGAVVFWFVQKLRRAQRATNQRSFRPPVTILLCLRGVDPFLQTCIQSLLNQDYPEYDILCIFDSSEDPAHEFIRKFEAEEKVGTLVVETHRSTCSLKCNSLIEAINALPEIENQVFVIVDGDCIVDKNWLVDLVAPLADEKNVASSGNRWYTPTDNRLGTLVRYLWNMAAIPQMQVYNVLWGGSLALRGDFVRNNLLGVWEHSLFEDSPILVAANRAGKKVVAIPDLLVPNRESATLVKTYKWMRRQLMTNKMYHPSFPLVATHCYSSCLTLLLVVSTMVANLVTANWSLAWVAITCLLVYAAFYFACLVVLENNARRVLESRRDDLPARHRVRLSTCLSILATQIVYCLATTAAIFARRTRWRGVEYLIERNNKIEMVEYKALGGGDHSVGSAESVEI